jgi:hypothetical protein
MRCGTNAKEFQFIVTRVEDRERPRYCEGWKHNCLHAARSTNKALKVVCAFVQKEAKATQAGSGTMDGLVGPVGSCRKAQSYSPGEEPLRGLWAYLRHYPSRVDPLRAPKELR